MCISKVPYAQLVHSVSSSEEGQLKLKSPHHEVSPFLLQPLLDSQLSSSRCKPSKGRAWCSGQLGVGGLSHVPILEAAFQDQTVHPWGEHVPPQEQLCSQLRDARAKIGMKTEQVENIKIPLCFCPYYFPGMSYPFGMGVCREKIPIPLFPTARLPQAGLSHPCWHLSRRSLVVHFSMVRRHRSTSLSAPAPQKVGEACTGLGKWFSPSRCVL